MKAGDWIDRVKAARGWDSDYRAAKELGLSRNTISNYRSGLRFTLDEDTAIKVAHALDAKPEVILVDQILERSRNDEAKAAFAKVLKRLGGVAAAVVVTLTLGAMAPRDAMAGVFGGNGR